MAAPKSAWGIDIGQCALKALKLSVVGGELQVEVFDIIEHPKILSQPDADRKQLVLNALEQFLARNNVSGSTVAVAVPGQTSFTRFVKLPPVEPRRVPDIVRFEAEQQIPFPIEEVIWRWQTFMDPDSPDVEVGIFAMKRLDVEQVLERFSEVELGVDVVQMAPLALYNFMAFDGQIAPKGATLLADVGTDKTDLVVADGPRIWTRTINIGGNSFTEALVRAFKLSFSKAEKLKRTAASSKYARQIFQAMRPVFADLVQEIQRSVGYYASVHREARFKRLVGLGNGFRLPGLQKFLEQNLGMQVVRIDSFNRLSASPNVNAPTFTENVLSFAVAYGLALQGLEQTPVNTNLIPDEISRRRQWAGKRPWFAGAAAALIAAFVCPVVASYKDYGALTGNPGALRQANQNISSVKDNQNAYSNYDGKAEKEERSIKAWLSRYEYRDWWPTAQALVSRSVSLVTMGPLPASDKDSETLRKLTGTTDPAERKKLFEGLQADAGILAALKMGTDDETRESLLGRIQSDRGVLEALDMTSAPLTRRSLAGRLLSEQAILRAIPRLSGTGAEEAAARKALIDKLRNVPRNQRRVLTIQSFETTYLPNVDVAHQTALGRTVSATEQPTKRGVSVATTAGRRGYEIVLRGKTPLPQATANTVLAELRRTIDEISKGEDMSPVKLVGALYDFQVGGMPGSYPKPHGRYPSGVPAAAIEAMLAAQGERMSFEAGPGAEEQEIVSPDPILPDESTAGDTDFQVRLWIAVGDGTDTTTR